MKSKKVEKVSVESAAKAPSDGLGSNGFPDATLALVVAWMETAAQYAKNAEYYRSLVVSCGEAIGESAHICDDGRTRSEDVLCAKVPSLVRELVARVSELEKAIVQDCHSRSRLLDRIGELEAQTTCPGHHCAWWVRELGGCGINGCGCRRMSWPDRYKPSRSAT